MNTATKVAVARVLSDLVGGDHIDPEGEAEQFVELLAKEGYTVVRLDG